MRSRRSTGLFALGVLALASSCRFPGGTAATGTAADSARISRDVAHLADDRLEGRRTGTPGNDSAAAWLARRYRELRLLPIGGADRGGTGSRDGSAAFLQSFTAFEPVRGGPPQRLQTQNVVAMVRGTDATLRAEYVIIGAHFDHLGRSTSGALDPDQGAAIRNGADDNASGTAAVLELARRFSRRPARRSMIFAHFSGEEQGLLGSAYFVEHPPVPLDRVTAMLNFDMVGRLRNDRLIVYGAATAAEMRTLLDSANATAGFTLAAVGDGFGPSDQSSFYGKDLPVLHFFTDLHPDYHRATDDAEKVSAAGIVRVVDFAERVARAIADRATKLTFTRAPVAAAATAARQSSGAYFGSIPDMGAADQNGMRLSGVSPGGPAEQAGLKAGDLIIEFGGKPVRNLYDYTDAIGACQPGDTVVVVFLRGASRERLSVTVTLGRRGG
jgi:hypothetical protein